MARKDTTKPDAKAAKPPSVAEAVTGLEAIERFLLPLTGGTPLGNIRSVIQLVSNAEARVALATREAERLDGEATTKRAELARIATDIGQHQADVTRETERQSADLADVRTSTAEAIAGLRADVTAAENRAAMAKAAATREQEAALEQLRRTRAAEERRLAERIERLTADEARLVGSIGKLQAEVDGFAARTLKLAGKE